MKGIWLIIAICGLFFFAQAAQADWTAAKRLTWTDGESYNPAIAIDSSNAIHVVWFDDTPGDAQIYYKRSADGGGTWSTSKRITWTSGGSNWPAMTIDSNNIIHVVWHYFPPSNNEIYYKNSQDEGATWSASKRITWTSGSSVAPAIAVDSSNAIHVVWQDYTPGNYEIYYKSSQDEGATWSATRRLTWTSGWSAPPAISIDSNDTIHVVWEDDTPGNYEIYYKSSQDEGATWSATRRLTWTSGWSASPALAVDSSDTIHVVWRDDTPNKVEIHYRSSTDGGATWMATKRLTWNFGWSAYPALATDLSNGIHVVWEDSTPGNMAIYYKRSPDGGATWSAAQRLNWTSGSSGWPALALDSTNMIHIVWDDDSPGNNEIYYKNGN